MFTFMSSLSIPQRPYGFRLATLQPIWRIVHTEWTAYWTCIYSFTASCHRFHLSVYVSRCINFISFLPNVPLSVKRVSSEMHYAILVKPCQARLSNIFPGLMLWIRYFCGSLIHFLRRPQFLHHIWWIKFPCLNQIYNIKSLFRHLVGSTCPTRSTRARILRG